MRNLGIIKNAAMTIRHQGKDKRNMKIMRVSSLSALLIAAGALLFATGARATVVDLINGDSGTINGAIFQFTQPQPTGTGIIQPFLRVQSDPTEQGYNTSGGTPFDDKAGPWTHNLTFADLMTTAVTINGQNYFKLLLDINQISTPSGRLLSLDQLQFYTSSTGSLTTTNISSLGTLRYTFNAGDAVYMDYFRNHGSGSGDMFAFIPTSLFAGTAATDFVYMYCHFGNTYASNDGFEEWALVVNPIPEASTIFPIIGLLAAVFSTQFVRRRQLQQLLK